MKCHICGNDMKEVKTEVESVWGEYKIKITGVKSFICEECKETVFTSLDAQMLQKLAKSFAETEIRPEYLDVTETADLLRVSKQTVYNMIKDGRLKPIKVGREWRFIRKDIECCDDDHMFLAARNGDITEGDKEIIRKYTEK